MNEKKETKREKERMINITDEQIQSGKAEIMKIKDTTERQKAWGEYLKAQKE